MPFLIPAVVAFTCDVAIVWLNRPLATEGFASAKDSFVYQVQYLIPVAVLRILLLSVPLLLHSYRGTALQCPFFYQLLYWGTLVLVVLQMMALALINPESIEAIFPLRRQLLEHLHELRRIWWILTFSALSNACHLILFWHVRSTAPLTYSYVSSFGGSAYYTKAPSVYYALRHRVNGNNGNSQHFQGHNHHYEYDAGSSARHYRRNGLLRTSSSDDLMHAMNEFMVELNTRLKRAKQDWTSRLEDFTTRLSHNSATERNSSPRSLGNNNAFFHLSPFRVMLQLFAYEDVLNNGKLDAVFELDDGVALTFFVPQLLSFLLHGALQCSPQLEEWILNKCRSNVYFAHRCYWFLRAWCLQVPTTAPEMSLSRNNSESQLTGLAPFLDLPSSPDHRVVECGPMVVGRRSSRTGGSAGGSQAGGDDSSQRFFSPDEHDMIERLLMRVKECGEQAAHVLQYGAVNRSIQSTGTLPLDGVSLENAESTVSETDVATQLSRTAASLDGAVKLGIVPFHPLNGSGSVRHFDVLTAQARYGFLPLDQTRNAALEQDISCFEKSPQFLDSLLFLADSLFQVPPKQRKEELRRSLRALECELLPSNAVYLPVGGVHHRVWRIVADESIAISTKERVPCIVCLEVVDVPARRRRTFSRPGMFGKFGKSNNTDESTSTDTAIEPSESVSSSFPDAEDAFLSEAEAVRKWRDAPRDAQRQSSLFDKVKVVGSQVQDHLNQYRERSVSDEMQSLTLVEALVEPVPRVLSGFASDVESGSEVPEEGVVRSSEAVPTRGLSRASSGASLVSMGQWSSPIGDKSIVRTETVTRNDVAIGGLRRRMDREFDDSAPSGSANGSGLKYGSDQEEEMTSPSKTRNGIEVSTKPPPVVFREDWKAKQDRVRKNSAYGTHPGWRLLPILVKANDDLRQEQLASALIYKMSSILAREKVPVWLNNYEILALTETGGIIEAIPDTISLDSLKKNDSNFTTLKNFFHSHFSDTEDLADAKANFVESLAAYSIVCFLLQIKDRHNGNILLDNRGHLIHIDFGFFFLSSPGKNAGFESAPFKLTRDFVDFLDGPNSHTFRIFRALCVKTFIALRRHCMELILMVEMLKNGNEELKCFRGRPDDAIREFRERFRLDLNDRACREYVHSLVDDSIENWRTDWYDRYQRYFVGVL